MSELLWAHDEKLYKLLLPFQILFETIWRFGRGYLAMADLVVLEVKEISAGY